MALPHGTKLPVRDYGAGKCIKCDASFQRRSAAVLSCPDCRHILTLERRARSTQRRRERRLADPQGEKARIARAPSKAPEYVKAYKRRRLLKLGAKVTGVPIQCCDCGKTIVRDNPARVRCAECKAAKAVGRATEWNVKNAEHRNAWFRARYAASHSVRLNSLMSGGIGASLKGRKGGRPWRKLVSYSLDDLKAHLERQFTKGMTWENMGEWHIDHIVPLASFSFETPEDEAFKAAWSLTNLRPLWASENTRKGARRTHLL